MAQKLFEYAVLYHPRPTKKQKDDGDGASSVIVIAPKTILAKDDKVAILSAARLIPEKYADKLDQVEIIVRPF